MADERLNRTGFLSAFTCLGAECEDTCCKGWSMQVDAETLERYRTEQPKLLDAVMEDGSGSFVMRRDPTTQQCVKLEEGLCGVHKRLGSDFLGDACHFYPRVTRRLGDTTLMAATLSCPEITRIAFSGDYAAHASLAPFPDRMPVTVKNYLPEGLSSEAAMQVYGVFLDAAADASISAERIMARIVSVARSLTALPAASWAEAVAFYFKMADMRLPVPEPVAVDPFNLVHAFMGIISASRKPRGERLMATFGDMTATLRITPDWEAVTIALAPESGMAWQQAEAEWNSRHAERLQPVLRRWIAAQLALATFPFAGFGGELTARAHVIGVRFATFRLALIAACAMKGETVDAAQCVRIAQSLARVLDHLADPELSLLIYSETGWLRESRLRALIGDK